MRMRNGGRLAIAGACAAVALVGACSSSSGHPSAAKVVSAPGTKAAVTTTTQPTAIGLRTNTDEKAEFGPDKPIPPLRSR
jgi:hypothetical protein